MLKEKMNKILKVVKKYPKYIINYPYLILYHYYILKNEGVYRTVQYAYDLIQRERKSRDLNYFSWIKNQEMTPKKLKEQKEEINSFIKKPIISILIPLWNVSPLIFNETINSAQNQSYPYLEICIVGNTKNKLIHKIIKEKQKKDKRIKVKYTKCNEGIVRNLNNALNIARGEYFCVLDHDDTLAQNALFEIVKLLQIKDADIVYSDEDKINLDGSYGEPTFRPDWSPNLLLSHAYILHLCVYKKKFVKKIGNFREEYEGAQDYDLLLRATEKTKKIFHIPKILYHWRKSFKSTSFIPYSKTYAYFNSKKALINTLQRRKIKAKITQKSNFSDHRINYPIPKKQKISIIINLTKNQKYNLRCIDNVEPLNNEIIVITNKKNTNYNKKMTFYYIKSEKERVSTINEAVLKSKGEFILFIDGACHSINKESIHSLIEYVQQKNIGVVCGKCFNIYGDIIDFGIIVSNKKITTIKWLKDKEDNIIYKDSVKECSAISDKFSMMKKRTFIRLGGFDKKIRDYYFIDFCLRLKEKGYTILVTPYAKGMFNKDFNEEFTSEEEKYFKEKWRGKIPESDPYYNVNLSLNPSRLFQIKSINEN